MGRGLEQSGKSSEGEEEKGRGTEKGKSNEEKRLGQREKEGNGARGREGKQKEGGDAKLPPYVPCTHRSTL